MQAGDRHDVIEARGPERGLGRALDARAVAGQDRRGEGAVLPRHDPLDMRRRRHPDAEGKLAQGAGVGPVGLDHGGPRVAHRPDPLEPGEAAVVEAPGLGRRRRRRQPRLPEQPPARLQEIGRGRRVERDPHPRRRARRAPARGSPRGRAGRAAGRWPSGRGRRSAPRRSRSSRRAAPAPRRSGCAAPPPRTRAPAGARRGGATPRQRPDAEERGHAHAPAPPPSAASIQPSGSTGTAK